LTWKLGKQINVLITNKPIVFQFKKVVKAREFTWRVTTNCGGFQLLGYELYASMSGPTSQVDNSQ
jgi:hypothetical protein